MSLEKQEESKSTTTDTVVIEPDEVHITNPHILAILKQIKKQDFGPRHDKFETWDEHCITAYVAAMNHFNHHAPQHPKSLELRHMLGRLIEWYDELDAKPVLLAEYMDTIRSVEQQQQQL